MSNREKNDGASAFEAGRKRADNPHAFGTHDWTDWKDGFDQAEACRERESLDGQVAKRLAETS